MTRSITLLLLGALVSNGCGEVSAPDVRPLSGSFVLTQVNGKALPDTKNVVGTNVIEIGWRLDPRTGRVLLLSAEDNLVKGASGQAIQSFNLMSGWPETTALL